MKMHLLCYNEETWMISFAAVVFFSVVIHFFILGFGIYTMLRVLEFRPLVSFSAASMAAFSVCGLILSGWQNIYAGISYIPLFLALFILTMTHEGKKSILYSSLGGVVLGLSGLASTSHGVLILIAVFAMVYAVYMWSFRNNKANMLKATGFSFLTGCVGVGIMSVSLLPFVQFFWGEAV